ncbi:DMT family transporter [Alphaproteobacteria bacterium]|nr:DMT family transporter [Alphaproteobacteria bacterium]
MLKLNNFFPLVFVILWSSAFITSKIIVEDASPFIALSFRFIIVAFIFFVFFILFSERKVFSFKSVLEALVSGILFHGFYLGGVFYALSKGASASIIALIVSLQPIMTAVLAQKILKEFLSKIQWFGILIGFLGAGIVIVSDLNDNLTILALCSGLVGLISSSIGIIWQKRIVNDLSLSANNFLQALGASLFHLLLAICFENYFINFTSSFLIAMIWQVLVISLGAFLILMWMLKYNDAGKTSTLFFLIPPVSAIMAYLILQENFTHLDIFGLFLSSIGVFIVTKNNSIK